jgi:uncharacterized tellurite resistance protein B-like protein
MIPQLTINEKFAIVAILSEIMKADGIIHPKEEEYMDGVFKLFNVTINDLEDIGNLDNIQAKCILDGMTNEKRSYVRSLFIEMAECDGYIHPKEMQLINRLF